jgi:hypothetical protein
MTLSWQILEREIISLLREYRFDLECDGGETFVNLKYDFPLTFSLTTFAKELAKRVETSR